MSQVDHINRAALDAFFLARLGRFVRLANHLDDPVPAEWRRLARHATLAAYRDCVARELGEAADDLIESARRRSPRRRHRAGGGSRG